MIHPKLSVNPIDPFLKKLQAFPLDKDSAYAKSKNGNNYEMRKIIAAFLRSVSQIVVHVIGQHEQG
jgi:hypothetical protein